MIGVLVMAYGGPGTMDEVEPYLRDVRGGRPTSPEVVHEVRQRYQSIGGRSPILERTQAQAAALETALNQGGPWFKVYTGMRHWHPYIAETLHRMEEDGIRYAVALAMAPHYSDMSIGAYMRAIEASGSNIEITPIKSWHLLPGYIAALAANVHAALERFPEEVRGQVPVIFTAHSLPESILEKGDPYVHELMATEDRVVERLGDQPHTFAFQSAAISSVPWLGPDAGAVIQQLAGQGQTNVLIAPIGFVCEHVEILYDVDIVYQELAASLGVHLERIDMLNTSPAMISGLADLVKNHAPSLEVEEP